MQTRATEAVIPSRPTMPEQRLMMAILEDALTTVRKLARVAPIGRPTRVLMTEQAWFDSDDRSWPFSFRNVCDALDLDVDAVRRVVHETLVAE